MCSHPEVATQPRERQQTATLDSLLHDITRPLLESCAQGTLEAAGYVALLR